MKIEHATFVDTLAQWKQAYIDIQDKVDMLILAPPSFIETEQDQADARAFVLQNTKIPTGSVEEWIAPYSLVCYAKVGGEQGEWAARAALRILSGVSPDRIPVAVNHHARLCLNMPLAKKLGIRFPVEMIEQASLISEK